MTRKIIENQTKIEEKLKSFHKRWNIEISELESWNNFKNRVLNSYSSILSHEFLYNEKCDEEFSTLIGIHFKLTKKDLLTISLTGKDVEDCFTYNFFKKETDFKKILLGIEVITWMTEISDETKKKFIYDIGKIVKITNIAIEIKKIKNEILFYPAGAKLLDIKLVNDNLDWLIDYPKIYETFKNSLLELGVQGKERQVIDNLRLTLELVLKEKLNNSKSLENQKAELGKYLKSKEISSEISNLIWVVLDYYSKYQNNKIKHSDNANSVEVEFLLYLTGTLMRLLLK